MNLRTAFNGAMVAAMFAGARVWVAVLTFPLLTPAAELAWDANLTTNGAQDGAGTWNTSTANWWNGTVNTNFSSIGVPDNAVFGATNGEAGTVTLGAANGDAHLYQNVTNPATGSALTGIWQPDGRTNDPANVTDASPRTPRSLTLSGSMPLVNGRSMWRMSSLVAQIF